MQNANDSGEPILLQSVLWHLVCFTFTSPARIQPSPDDHSVFPVEGFTVTSNPVASKGLVYDVGETYDCAKRVLLALGAAFVASLALLFPVARRRTAGFLVSVFFHCAERIVHVDVAHRALTTSKHYL